MTIEEIKAQVMMLHASDAGEIKGIGHKLFLWLWEPPGVRDWSERTPHSRTACYMLAADDDDDTLAPIYTVVDGEVRRVVRDRWYVTDLEGE